MSQSISKTKYRILSWFPRQVLDIQLAQWYVQIYFRNLYQIVNYNFKSEVLNL